MRDFAPILTSLWKSSRKFKSLRGNDAARLLYLYLHTCPESNSIGCYPLPKGYALTDLGWNEKTFDRAIEDLCKADLVHWNAADEVVYIVAFLKKRPTTNSKHAAGAAKIAAALPDCEEKRLVINDLLGDPYVRGNDRIGETLDRAIETLSIGTANTETETETEKEPPLIPPSEPKKPKTERRSKIDPNWKPNATAYEIGVKEGYTRDETEKLGVGFVDYWLGCGKPIGDTDRTFYNHLRSNIAHNNVNAWRRSNGTPKDGGERQLTPQEQARFDQMKRDAQQGDRLV